MDVAVELPDGPNKELVNKLCTECHTLDSTVRMRLTRRGWSDVVDEMVAQGAGGSDAELRLVIDYLTTHFGAN